MSKKILKKDIKAAVASMLYAIDENLVAIMQDRTYELEDFDEMSKFERLIIKELIKKLRKR